MAEYAGDIFVEGFVPLLCTSLSVSALGIGTQKLSGKPNRRDSRGSIPAAPAPPRPAPAQGPNPAPAPITYSRISRHIQRDRAVLLLGETEASSSSDGEDSLEGSYDDSLDDSLDDSVEDSAEDSDEDGDEDEDSDEDDDDDRASRQGLRRGTLSRLGFRPDEEESVRSSSSDLTQVELREDDSDSDVSAADQPDREPEDEETKPQQSETEVIPAPVPEPRPAGLLIDPVSEEGERILSDIRNFLHYPNDMEPLDVIINIAHNRDTIFRNLRYTMPFMFEYSERDHRRYTNIAMSPQRDTRHREFVENLYIIDWKRIFESGEGDYLVKLIEQRYEDIQKAIEFFNFLAERSRLEGDRRYYLNAEVERLRSRPRREGLQAMGMPSPMRNEVTQYDIQDEQSHEEEQEERESNESEVHKARLSPIAEEEASDPDMEEGVIHANLARAVVNIHWAEGRLLDIADDFYIHHLELVNSIEDLAESELSLQKSIEEINTSIEYDELSDLEFDDDD